jgi:hypothetical protein
MRLTTGEVTLLALRLFEERGQRRGKELTRARISSSSLKQISNREHITPQWIDELNEYLLPSGWILIRAGSTYAAIKVSVVENWPRVSAKRLEKELEAVRQGTFDFKSLSYLLSPQSTAPVVQKQGKTRSGKYGNGQDP